MQGVFPIRSVASHDAEHLSIDSKDFQSLHFCFGDAFLILSLLNVAL